MAIGKHLVSGIRAFRPFLPAKDYEMSLRFYKAIGFEAYPLGDAMAEMSLGAHAFLLHYVKEPAAELVMHVLVKDVRAWWKHIDALNLSEHFEVSAPAPPRIEPWGLTVLYVTDPSGIVWHFAEDSKSYEQRA